MDRKIQRKRDDVNWYVWKYPACTRALTTSGCPNWRAMCSGVVCLLQTALISADHVCARVRFCCSCTKECARVWVQKLSHRSERLKRQKQRKGRVPPAPPSTFPPRLDLALEPNLVDYFLVHQNLSATKFGATNFWDSNRLFGHTILGTKICAPKFRVLQTRALADSCTGGSCITNTN